MLATLNINSINNKFDQLKLIIEDNIDVLVLTETKLDSSFPTSQFLIDGFTTPFRRDRDKHGGGILIYVRDDIPSKQLERHNFPNDIEGIFIEINLRKVKWLMFGTYHPPQASDSYYFENVSNALDLYTDKYDKFVLVGDFNAEENELYIGDFLELYNAKCIVKDPTCYKSIQNPTCIDLFLTNSPLSFQHTTTVSNGLSDFHKLVLTTLKTKFTKARPTEVTYRNYKNFDSAKFKNDLKQVMTSDIKDYGSFEDCFLSILNEHAPLKKKLIRANHAPYMTKVLKKAMMKRHQLATKFYKSRKSEDLKIFKKQNNFVSKLYKKERKRFYTNLDVKEVLQEKTFWKNIKPLFTNQNQIKQKITIVKGDNIIHDDKKIAQTFNDFFKDAVYNLDLQKNVDILNSMEADTDCPIDIIINKFKYHPSILLINENVQVNRRFEFSEATVDMVQKELKNLNPKKATTFKNIPSKIIKSNYETCATVLTPIYNECIKNALFPEKMKLADITPVHKKDDVTNVKNYRPISVLPSTSKVFERLLQTEINGFISTYLSKYLCGYRKGFSAQHALISLLEKWKSTLDAKGYAGAVLMDLSKAFDCINHELLLAKLYAYGFSKNAVQMINSYLSKRWQRTKVNSKFSSWIELLTGVPQGSVLGPLLFNIYLNDLFWVNRNTDACNFADDTTIYSCDHDLETVIRNLEHDSLLAMEWFECNNMKLNPDKCHLLVSGHKHEWLWAKIGEDKIWESQHQKLLGIDIDRDLSFKIHISNICKKANIKLTALRRYCKFLTVQRRRTLFKSFVESQFSHCPLVWMFHSRNLNNKINQLHKRALRMVYDDDTSSFQELLAKDGAYTIHERHIQLLAIECYKTYRNIGPVLLNDIFERTNYVGPNLRNKSDFVVPSISSVHFGENSLKYFGAKIWTLIPLEIREVDTLAQFKTLILQWVPQQCPCSLCKTYVNGLGFVNII